MLNSKNKLIYLWEKVRYKCPDEKSVIKNIILPIFESLGWSEKNGLKRSTTSQDIIIENENITVIMECKKINKEEFNIFENTGNLQPNGTNYGGDGVGQLRYYCIMYMNSNPQKKVIPIFSNGLRWVIFDYDNFLDMNKIHDVIKPEEDIVFDKLIIESCFLKKLQRKLMSLGLTCK